MKYIFSLCLAGILLLSASSFACAADAGDKLSAKDVKLNKAGLITGDVVNNTSEDVKNVKLTIQLSYGDQESHWEKTINIGLMRAGETKPFSASYNGGQKNLKWHFEFEGEIPDKPEDKPKEETVDEPDTEVVPATDLSGTGPSTTKPFDLKKGKVTFTFEHKGTGKFIATLAKPDGAKVRQLIFKNGEFEKESRIIQHKEDGKYAIIVEAEDDADWSVTINVDTSTTATSGDQQMDIKVNKDKDGTLVFE